MIPKLAIQNLAQNLDRMVNIGGIQKERSKTKTHDVGRAKIADDTFVDEGLDRSVSVLKSERDVAATDFRVTRADKLQVRAVLRDALNDLL